MPDLSPVPDAFVRALVSGGDQRLALDAAGRNPYGARPAPAAVMPFGSCTCSSIGTRGFAAARATYEALLAAPDAARFVDDGFERARARIAAHLRLDDDTSIVFAASGTDTELLVAALALQAGPEPLVNVVVGPHEVGSGTVLAAGVRVFGATLPDGSAGELGAPLDPAFADRVTVRTVSVRTAAGDIRDEAEIDAEATAIVEAARTAGARVVLHVVAFSKTGVHAPTLPCVARLRERHPGLVVLIDAAQGRFSRRGLQEVLREGYAVSITGSKFFGGPAFSGALLVPARAKGRPLGFRLPPVAWPATFGRVFTAAEMPRAWVAARASLPPRPAVGLLLRWEAALAEMDAYYASRADYRLAVLRHFERRAPEVLAASPNLDVLPVFPPLYDDDSLRLLESKTTVFGFRLRPATLPPDVDVARLRRLHAALLDGEPAFHLGQPVRLGESGWALRVAIGGELIVRVAEDVSLGSTLAERVAWLDGRLEALVARIDALVAAGAVDVDRPGAA